MRTEFLATVRYFLQKLGDHSVIFAETHSPDKFNSVCISCVNDGSVWSGQRVILSGIFNMRFTMLRIALLIMRTMPATWSCCYEASPPFPAGRPPWQVTGTNAHQSAIMLRAVRRRAQRDSSRRSIGPTSSCKHKLGRTQRL